MSRLRFDNPAKIAVAGPLVAVGYYVTVFAIRYIGCLPRFADTEFADIPVIQYLLVAISAAALFLTFFAGIAGLRHYWQARAIRGEAGNAGRRWGLLGVASAVTAFAGVALLVKTAIVAVCP